jgi:chitodextrinase
MHDRTRHPCTLLIAIIGLAAVATAVDGTGSTAHANEPPLCNVGGPYLACIGYPLQLDGTGSSDPDGTIVSYRWDFGDGTTGEGPMPTHVYEPLPIATVTLEVTDDSLATSQCETFVVIDACYPPPSCDAGGPYATTVGDTLVFDASGSSGTGYPIVSYEWTFGDGSTGIGLSPRHAYTAEGVYTVTLLVVDADLAATTCSTTATIQELNPVASSTWGAIKAALRRRTLGTHKENATWRRTSPFYSNSR